MHRTIPSPDSLLLLAVALCLVSCPDPNGNGPDPSDPPPGPVNPISDAFQEALRESMDDSMSTWEPVGFQVAVLVEGYDVWTEAQGLADVSTGSELTVTDRFKAGSISNTFLAALLVQLEDEEAILLEQVPGLLYPGLSWGDVPTARQLLEHTSGVPDFRSHSDYDGSASWERAELLQLASSLDMLHSPGSQRTESATNYVLSSQLVEEVTGQGWTQVVADRYLDPLGLDATRLPEESDDWGSIVRGYVGSEDRTDAVKPSAVGADANLVTNASELASWGRALLGGEVVSAEVFNEMTSQPFLVEGGRRWGLGIAEVREELDGPIQWAHPAEIEGYGAWMGHRQDLGVTVVVLANSWRDDGSGTYNARYLEDIADELWIVVQQHVDPVAHPGDDDDSFQGAPEPSGQQRLRFFQRVSHLGEGAAPDHDGVELSGYWDFDNDGETVGHFTVTSANFSSGEPQGAVSCEIVANGTYDPTPREYEVVGSLSLESWAPQGCPDWSGVYDWQKLLQGELDALYFVPTDRVQDDWILESTGERVSDAIDSWAAAQGGDEELTLPFVVLGNLPSALPVESEIQPWSFVGHFWQLPGDL